MTTDLKTLIDRRGLKIGADQRARLERVIGRGGETAMAWADGGNLASATVVLLDEVPRAPQVDAFCNALSPETTVVIPYGENPQFDFVKSRLRCHGTVGAAPPDSPHQIWWGGRRHARPDHGIAAIRAAHIVSCVRRTTPEETSALHLSKCLGALGVSHTFNLNETYAYCDDASATRSQALLEAWETTDKPLIWLDPMSETDLSTLALSLAHADFAALPPVDNGIPTSLLHFGRSNAAHELLKQWHALCCEFSTLPASYMLDAAWAMIAAQRPLVTRWLSPADCKAVIDGVGAYPPAPSLYDLQNMVYRRPSQRQARRASRPGGPEPQCIVKSRFAGHGHLTVIAVTDTATARETAALVEDVTAAFAQRDGGFSSLGVTVCPNAEDAADAIACMTQGWLLYIRPGVAVADDIFITLSRHIHAPSLTYIASHPQAVTETTTGTTVTVSAARAVFGRFEHFNAIGDIHLMRPKPPLQLVS
jgi:hypothetical protein